MPFSGESETTVQQIRRTLLNAFKWTTSRFYRNNSELKLLLVGLLDLKTINLCDSYGNKINNVNI